MIEGIQKKAIDESAENKEKRTGGPDLMRSWDCSQIENEEEEESWQERDRMAAQWEEEQTLEGIMERRRMEGSSLNLAAMQKVPELVVNERMSPGTRVKSLKVKRKVPGWSMEELKKKPNAAVVEDTEDMRKWRSLSQSEINGLMLDKFGEENGRRRHGQVQGRQWQEKGL